MKLFVEHLIFDVHDGNEANTLTHTHTHVRACIYEFL